MKSVELFQLFISFIWELVSIRYGFDKEKYVYIKNSRFEFACHKLSDLTLTILCQELDKVLCLRKEFVDWMTKTLREDKLKELGI